MSDSHNDKNSNPAGIEKPGVQRKAGDPENGSMNSYIEQLLIWNQEVRAARKAALNALEDAILAKEALRINEERMRKQKDALQTAVNGSPLADSLNILSQIVILETKGQVRTAFYIADPDGSCLRPIIGAGNMPESYLKEIDGYIIDKNSIALGLAVPAARPILTADVFEEPLWEPWTYIAKKYDYRGCWSFPIKTREHETVGTFAMYFQTPRKASQNDIDLADIVTKTAAIIITGNLEAQERAKAERELRESEERYRNQLRLEVQQRTEDVIRLNAELKHLNAITANNYAESLRHVYINLETIVITEARNLSNSSRANLRRAQSAIQKMKLLTNDLNNYLQLYDIELKKEKFYPNNILQNVIESMQKRIDEANAKITIDTLPSLNADPALFSKLMTQLVDNAIKFRKENTEPFINISHSLVNHSTGKTSVQNKPFVIISVSDNGVGCQDTQIIFELFTQLHDHGKHKGSGMGLAICKKIMELHEGFITCDSQPENGARFSCYFPA